MYEKERKVGQVYIYIYIPLEYKMLLTAPLVTGRPVGKGTEGLGSPLMVILSGLSETWASRCSALRRNRVAQPRKTCSFTQARNRSDTN